MPSKAKMDGDVGGGVLNAVFKKDDVLPSDRYWQKWPDLFEHTSEPPHADSDDGPDEPEGGDG